MIATCLLFAIPCARGQGVPVDLTPEEAAYLKRVKSVRMCVDPDWAPFEWINKQGHHEGIAADLVQLVASRVGLKVELYPTTNWDESLLASRTGRCRIMSFLNQSPDRNAWLLFTEPIFYDQNIIITREEHPYIGDPRGLASETVALPRGTMVGERLRRDYPNLRIITTDSEPAAVKMVSERKADMTVRSLIVAAYAIKKEGLFNLKISGHLPGLANELRVGVLKEDPLLRNIIDKGVRTITPQEREAITNKHVSIQVQRGIDYTLIWQISLAALVAIGVVLLWNRKLSLLNRKLEYLSVTDSLTGLFNRNKLNATLESERLRALRFGHPFSLILIDLDHFKQVNDIHGHQAGDQILIELSAILRTHTRETDIVGRWGGEEFMIICPHTDSTGARVLAEHLMTIIRRTSFTRVGTQTVSLGLTSYVAGDSSEKMFGQADQALYIAKREGRNRVASI